MMSFMQAVWPVLLACLPLLALTIGHFRSSGESKTAITYKAANPAEFDEIGARVFAAPATATAKAASGAGGAGGAVTTSGLAEVLMKAADACSKTDVAAVDKVVGELEAFAGRLDEVEKMGPSGASIAEAMRQRTRDVVRHAEWLRGRMDVAKLLKQAEDMIAAGPEIEAETSCLESLRGLLRRFPAVADPEAEKSEPPDTLTRDEKAKADALKARAEFRRQFFTLKKAADEKQEKAASLRRQVQAWDALIALVKKGPGDARDKPLAEEATKLRLDAFLNYLEADVKEQTLAKQMQQKIDIWLDAARKAGREDGVRQKAQDLEKGWLEERVKPLKALTSLEKAAMEGYQPDGAGGTGKRKIGFFEKVKNTDRQYRYWTNVRNRQNPKLAKGEDQVNLLGEPVEPRYAEMSRRYADGRTAFLDGGHLSVEGIQAFAGELGKILGDCQAYRENHAKDEPIDKESAGWPRILADGQKAVDDFLQAKRGEGAADRQSVP